ncbi:hypothetical protein HYFRA_00004047, partial [Hymenoscyphus fraxineus]
LAPDYTHSSSQDNTTDTTTHYFTCDEQCVPDNIFEMGDRNDEIMGVDRTCWFLRIPLEIRMKIYSYLVAGSKHLNLYSLNDESPKYSQLKLGDPKFKLRILAVNSQIYNEASSLFFSNVTIHLGVMGLKDLVPNEWNHENMYYPSHITNRTPPRITKDESHQTWNSIWACDPMVWVASGERHQPRKPGQNPYKNERLKYLNGSWQGFLQPHIFTQFQKFSITITLEDLWEYWEEEYDIPESGIYTIRDFAAASHLFAILTKLLSGVTFLKHLEIILDVDEEGLDWGHPLEEDKDTSERLLSDGIIQSDENGFLYYFGMLDNVQNFDIKVVSKRDDLSPSNTEYRTLEGKSKRVIEELKKELAIRFSKQPVPLSTTEIVRQIARVQGNALGTTRLQLRTIQDRKNLSSESEETLLQMLELQREHQKKMNEMQRRIHAQIKEGVDNRTRISTNFDWVLLPGALPPWFIIPDT